MKNFLRRGGDTNSGFGNVAWIIIVVLLVTVVYLLWR